jgi:peptidoglycan/xylan/chitin deacetylase (PgdA/CDA1 family)
MTADEVVELSRHPLAEIGSHTIDHTVLGEASPDEAYREMAMCKERLENVLGEPVPSFCCPRCFYSPTCPEAARRAGHTNAVTCGNRGSWDPFGSSARSYTHPDGSVTFELKSCGLYYRAQSAPPARLAHWATSHRHCAECR